MVEARFTNRQHLRRTCREIHRDEMGRPTNSPRSTPEREQNNFYALPKNPYISRAIRPYRRILPLSRSFAGRLGETITSVQIALHQRGLTASDKRVWSTSSTPHAGAGCIIPQGGRLVQVRSWSCRPVPP
jgi:hypothetical protein